MKKNQARKLTLAKVTLRSLTAQTLSAADMRDVVGGTSGFCGPSGGCASDGCSNNSCDECYEF